MKAGESQLLRPWQLAVLVILRVAIGWHFLYEGIQKVSNPAWTSAPYLADSQWILGDLFQWIAATPSVLAVVDFLNAWGLTLIGLGLMLGCLGRVAAVSGIILLGLYYLAHPPFIGIETGLPTEGNYLFVDKNLVEMLALMVLTLFPTSQIIGLDRLIRLWKVRRESPVVERPQRSMPVGPDPRRETPFRPGTLVVRRELVKSLATLPFLGGFVFGAMKKRGWDSFEEQQLLSMGAGSVDAVSSATVRTFQYTSLKDLTGKMTYGQIGDLRLSRLFLGGNLMGGWAHARDLIYVSKLVKSYHTDEKVFETFRLAELCGVNTILTNPALCRVVNAYWRKRGGAIQFISDCAMGNDLFKGIQVSIDSGAHACYVQGGIADRLVAEGKVEEIARAVEVMRDGGVPAGVGGHALRTIQACVEAGIKPDFWVKTLHHCDYWSATPTDENDNIWCTNPEETITYMKDLPEPWIAFKILAAGAIPPEEGFRYAFENGADFICVGMYDFQIVDDVNLACSILSEDLDAKRPRVWRA